MEQMLLAANAQRSFQLKTFSTPDWQDGRVRLHRAKSERLRPVRDAICLAPVKPFLDVAAPPHVDPAARFSPRRIMSGRESEISATSLHAHTPLTAAALPLTHGLGIPIQPAVSLPRGFHLTRSAGGFFAPQIAPALNYGRNKRPLVGARC